MSSTRLNVRKNHSKVGLDKSDRQKICWKWEKIVVSVSHRPGRSHLGDIFPKTMGEREKSNYCERMMQKEKRRILENNEFSVMRQRNGGVGKRAHFIIFIMIFLFCLPSSNRHMNCLFRLSVWNVILFCFSASCTVHQKGGVLITSLTPITAFVKIRFFIL